MCCRKLLPVLLMVGLASRASALILTDMKVQAKILQAAIPDAEKAVAANDVPRARLILLAVSGFTVPDDLNAPFDAVAARCWPDEKITAETRDEAFKALDPVILKYAAPTSPSEREKGGDFILYPDVTGLENNLASGVSLGDLAEWILAANKQYPEAMKRALEFVALAPSPRWFDQYNWNGQHGTEFRAVRTALINLYLGPEIVAKHKKDELLPWSLRNVEEQLGMWGSNEDPVMLTFKAGEMERTLDLARFVDPEDAKLKELDAKVKGLALKAKKIYAAQVKSNRVPVERYRGEDASALRTAFKQLFEKDNPKWPVLRVSIYGEAWVERAVVTSAYNNIQAGIYRFLDAAVVCKHEKGVWVHPITFARQWTGTGNNFGPPRIYSWCDDYEILPTAVKP
ncbi:MAG: hypothetical protein HY321_12095 [Armatimonadetes bacterium]|nr:hypothetical protein [Armatimonadota bacterium]